MCKKTIVTISINLQLKKRNQLGVLQHRELRVKLTKLEPNIKSLGSKHQAQGSY